MILAGGRDAWKVAGLLASNHVAVVYTHTFTLPPRDTEAYDTQFKAAAMLYEAGVKLALAVPSASLVKNLPYTAAQAVAFGLPEAAALKAMTLVPAEVLGVAERLGSLEAGKDATLIATDGPLLDIRTNVKRMWIGGREVSLENRHTRLHEKYRSRPRLK
jgi:imidazolonepropionase-like amidohydrolase